MDRWHLPSVEASGKREPRVLFSSSACRAVVLDLRAGDTMGEHSVRERAVIQVVSGRVRVGPPGSEIEAQEGTLATFAPNERHTLSALEDSRLLLLLAPWPGDGHFTDAEGADPDSLPVNASAPPLR